MRRAHSQLGNFTESPGVCELECVPRLLISTDARACDDDIFDPLFGLDAPTRGIPLRRLNVRNHAFNIDSPTRVRKRAREIRASQEIDSFVRGKLR